MFLFLTHFSHMPVSFDKWPTVFDAVRAVHPLTPILIFGGGGLCYQFLKIACHNQYHTQMSNQTFDTAYGRSITDGLQELAVSFDLFYLYGTSPQDYTINQNPYPSNASLLSLFIADAVPYPLSINNTRDSIPAIYITNSGSQRFNVFQGPFTKNDQLTASPFTYSSPTSHLASQTRSFQL
ncbi:hypothetical protein EV424DRAFT_1372569 [Suillus variegatus]|nr:hypothetical protein EV424DRAFT_1372569 [Suillus variegatus]